MHLTPLQRASYVRCAGVTLPIKRHTTPNAYLYMSGKIARRSEPTRIFTALNRYSDFRRDGSREILIQFLGSLTERL
jgi:hypothetical protein